MKTCDFLGITGEQCERPAQQKVYVQERGARGAVVTTEYRCRVHAIPLGALTRDEYMARWGRA